MIAPDAGPSGPVFQIDKGLTDPCVNCSSTFLFLVEVSEQTGNVALHLSLLLDASNSGVGPATGWACKNGGGGVAVIVALLYLAQKVILRGCAVTHTSPASKGPPANLFAAVESHKHRTAPAHSHHPQYLYQEGESILAF